MLKFVVLSVGHENFVRWNVACGLKTYVCWPKGCMSQQWLHRKNALTPLTFMKVEITVFRNPYLWFHSVLYGNNRKTTFISVTSSYILYISANVQRVYFYTCYLIWDWNWSQKGWEQFPYWHISQISLHLCLLLLTSTFTCSCIRTIVKENIDSK